MHSRLFAASAALAATVFATSVQAQSIDPDFYEATMTVGQTIVIEKTITLAESGANLVDLFFLGDNTGSMYDEVANMKAGALDILGNVPAGADYNFGVGRYVGDPIEGVSPSYAYVENTPLGPSVSDAQDGINDWFASGGGDLPEANFFALKQMADNTGWRTGSQRLAVWFGDARSHTATTTEAQAIAALQAAGVQVIAFNSGGPGGGIDQYGQASNVVSATDGSLTHNFNGLSTSDFVNAVNDEITLATSTLDLIFGSTFIGSGLTLEFFCTDGLGCDGVEGGESREFELHITANELGTYEFETFAEGVAAEEFDRIHVVETVVPEPSTYVLLGTGLLALGFVAWRRKEEEGEVA